MMDRSTLHMEQPAEYTIQVQGWLGERWTTLFEAMEVHADSGNGSKITTLVGRMIDQAALHGLLRSLYTLGMPLILVRWDQPSDQEGEITS